MDVTIRIEKMDELIAALNNVSGIIGGGKIAITEPTAAAPPVPTQVPIQQSMSVQQPMQQPLSVQQPAQQMPVAPIPQTSVPTQAPVQQPYSAQIAQNVQMPAQAMTGSIPTTAVAQEYTQEQVSIAMSGLMDAGKKDAVMQILAAFGVQALVQIPKEQYPELVMKMREAGATI